MSFPNDEPIDGLSNIESVGFTFGSDEDRVAGPRVDRRGERGIQAYVGQAAHQPRLGDVFYGGSALPRSIGDDLRSGDVRVTNR